MFGVFEELKRTRHNFIPPIFDWRPRNTGNFTALCGGSHTHSLTHACFLTEI